MTLLFAATYPERVDSLILFGTGATLLRPTRPRRSSPSSAGRSPAYAARWGTEDSPVAAGMAPTLAARTRPSRLAPALRALRRQPGLAARAARAVLHMDVRELLPVDPPPPLVIHRTDDRVIPVERRGSWSPLLPNARLFEQPGEDHFSYAGDVDGWMDEFERFVTGRCARDRIARPCARPCASPRSAASPSRSTARRSRPPRGAPAAPGSCASGSSPPGGWPVTRDELFDLLWPDETDRTGSAPAVGPALRGPPGAARRGDRRPRERAARPQEVDTDLEALFRADDDAAIVAAYPASSCPTTSTSPGPRAPGPRRRPASSRAPGARRSRLLDDGQPRRRRRARAPAPRDRPYDEDAHRLLITALDRAGRGHRGRARPRRSTAAMAELGRPRRTARSGRSAPARSSEGSRKGPRAGSRHGHRHRVRPSSRGHRTRLGPPPALPEPPRDRQGPRR
jgi:hypothetical protein